MKEYKEGINWKDVDATTYTPIEQGIVLLKEGEGDKEARAFYDFILGDEAKVIFEKFGYVVK